jgi:hypothetical protein
MTFTDTQLAALAAYERNFLTAIRGKWALNPGGDAVRLIHSILTQATGQQRPLNTGCGTCLLHLLQDCGALYFADVEERAKAAARVSADAKPRKTRKAVTVKAKEDEA